MNYIAFASCFIDAWENGHNVNGCIYFMRLKQCYGFLTIITLSIYFVNNTVYIFGPKYVSVRRMIIELVIELLCCLGSRCEVMEREIHRKLIAHGIDLNISSMQYLGVLSITIIILEKMYYIMCSFCYDKDRKKPIVSKKIFQFLGLIIIMMSICDVFINSFNYYSCIQALQYSLSAGYLLFEPLKFVDESINDVNVKSESVVLQYIV